MAFPRVRKEQRAGKAKGMSNGSLGGEVIMALRPVQRLSIGDEAPDFHLPATGDTAGRGQKHKMVSLKSYRGKKNVVLVFFPAAFTPV